MKKKGLKIFLMISVNLVLFAVLLSIVSVMGLHYYTDSKLYPQVVARENAIKHYEKWILADLKTLEKNAVFKKTDYKKDAGPFLQSHIPIAGVKNQKNDTKQNQIVSRLFTKFPNWVTNKMDFNALTSDPDFASLDPKWIEQVKNYDHWSWKSQPEVQEKIQQATLENGIQRIGTLATLPIPDYTVMQGWAAVYAIKKLQIKDLQAGLKIYRKVAELINSNGNLIAQMTAVAMLKSEHKLLNDFQARDWQLIPIASIEAYRRLSWAWIQMVRQPFYSDLKPEIKNYATPSYGVCSGASENLIVLFGTRDFLEPQISFEKNFVQNYARAEKFQKSILSKCHLDDFSQLTELSSTAEKKWFSNQVPFPLAHISIIDHIGFLGKWLEQVNWSQVPFVRKFIGLNLFLDATPDSLSLYRELANEKK